MRGYMKETIEMDLAKLHDATLVRFILDWKSGDFVIELRPTFSPSELMLIAKDISNIHCTRAMEWGISMSVNSVQITELEENIKKLEIQMQSGDVLSVETKAVTIIAR
jgi:hypothetical protein